MNKETIKRGCVGIVLAMCGVVANAGDKMPQAVDGVRITDSFWTPKLRVWNDVTIPDVLRKFEGQHTDNPAGNDAFANFDKVAAGDRGTHNHFGAPWFDGLIFESIRGIADYMQMFPDPALEARIDAYIERVAAAQATEPTGYLSTYTLLQEPTHRWGDYGGFLRFQHDVYNAGMMIEAAVHYYRATGKTALLECAVRYANHMAQLMGPEPRRNIVPSHSGPEEAVVKLYQLFRDEPELKQRISQPVDEQQYLDLVTFWIENRGHHCGYPHWLEWGNPEAEKWIKEAHYNSPEYGAHSRPTWGDYAQDSIPVFDQQTIEGHAVRATLLATGIATMALENHDPRYIDAAARLWDNMAGRRMFITGGVGAIHDDEKFGPDYFLPPGAYLETCAAVGAAFFSGRMHELTHKGMYVDQLEQVLYNSLLTAVSLAGDNYTYQNPLNATGHNRWEWHGCPCCPPMFLKITSLLPSYIYNIDGKDLYVNLFVGNEANLDIAGVPVKIEQQTAYPWEGTVNISVDPEKAARFGVKVRIPGWAQGKENPYDLYTSDLKERPTLTVNGKPVEMKIRDGYVTIDRKWRKGDNIALTLPMQPRVITPHPEIADLAGTVCIASGPVVYSFESVDNPNLDAVSIDPSSGFSLNSNPDLLGGVNTITCGEAVAIPYYAIANRRRDTAHKVWLPRR